MAEPWRDNTFNRRRKATIQDVNVDSNLSSFSVLIKKENDIAYSTGNAQTLNRSYYEEGNATALKFDEIFTENDATDGSITDRVKKATVYASPIGEQNVLWQYYDKVGSASPDAANAYDANTRNVWHLGDGATYGDSKGSDDFNLNSGATADTSAQIHEGVDLSGSASHVSRDSGSLDAFPFTVSILFNRDDSHDGTFYWTGVGTVINEFVTLRCDTSTNKISAILRNTSARIATTGNASSQDTWHYAAMTCDSGDGTLISILDADFANKGSFSLSLEDFPATVDRVAAGYSRDLTPTSAFDGTLEELIVSTVVRSDDWLKFQKFNYLESDNELTWGIVELKSASALLWHDRRQRLQPLLSF